MNARERYLAALLFQRPDKIPFLPGVPRESTLRAWHQQGLPTGVDYYTFMLEKLGLDPEPTPVLYDLGVSFRMIPEFEEKILDHRNDHYVLRDWMGAIVEISDRYDPTYLRSPKDFVTRKWHRFPVETDQDWELMKCRYDPSSPGRYPHDFFVQCQESRSREYAVGFQLNGPFWQMREWLGLEKLCFLFLDDPEFVREMIDFWTEFVSRTMKPILDNLDVDRVGISEDMAFKGHSMISPAMVREFLLPAYKAWVAQIKESGCRIVDMDCDGYVGELIPIWIEAGINCCDPIEVAAGNDITQYRKRFGKSMAYTGGIDKRAIAAGGDAMRSEVMRVVPALLEDGGYIPGCDHAVPPDISWPNFLEYARLVAELTGWL